MVTYHLFFLSLCLSLINHAISDDDVTATSAKSPNIVFVLFDDLGWMDVSYNGGQLPTPNMDSLFSESVMLQKHYIHLICSVSRSQFLTGRYAMYSGYGKMSPWGDGHLGGIPIGIPTLAQWLKTYNSDYTNYAVGKWMMGYSTIEQLPESKGFDHFFGAYTSAIDYSNGKISANKCGDCNPNRYDLHDDGEDYEMHEINRKLHYKNTIFDFRDKMNYYLDAEIEKNVNNDFNSPFYMYFPIQTPHGPLSTIREYSDQCEEIVGDMVGNEDARGHRLKYCEAILASDDIIGDVVSKLKKHDEIWDNTIFVLSSDNGGDVANNGCNYPLRGTKGTLFEGNQRVITSVGGGLIPKELHGQTRESLVSSLDWTPTLLAFAGIYDSIDEKDRTWDGINQYNLIMYGDDYQDRIDRDHLVLNIEDRDLNSATILFKNPLDNDKLYKYATTTKKLSIRLDGWCVPDENNDWNMIINDVELNPDLPIEAQDVDGAFVFNLDDDISEWTNLLVKSDNINIDIQNVVDYAREILLNYVDNPLFSSTIRGLWEHHDESAYALKDEMDGKEKDAVIYLRPWIEFDDYMDEINGYLDYETEKKENPISDELRKLYNVEWKSPFSYNHQYKLKLKNHEQKEEKTELKNIQKVFKKNDIEYVSVPSSCLGLEDGEYLMKLIDSDDYPLIKVQCSNEYMLINIKKDSRWKEYFSSWQSWHYDIAGPDKNDAVNYNDWFIPAPSISESDIVCPIGADYIDWEYDRGIYTDPQYPTQFVIAPDCNVCDEDDKHTQQYLDKTTYNMNSAAYGLFFGLRRPACDFDWDTLECHVCDHAEGNMVGSPRPNWLAMEDTAQNDRTLPNTMFGVCLTETRSAYQCATRDWTEFTGYHISNYKPSLGVNGRFCQCAKVKKDYISSPYFNVRKEEYDSKLFELQMNEEMTHKIEEDLIEDAKNDGHDNIVYLYQSDFEIGTYRITKPGRYFIMEDIEFNFNGPDPSDVFDDDYSPNHPADNDYWWPPSDDIEILEKYPGAGYKGREQYHLGYFAGITIETHDVELNLQGHTIKQSKEYFYQQPFFANIALSSQPFLPNQGPGFYGSNPSFASNVVIKNGIIGRAAHHGIQGAKNKNIRIEDIKIRHFMTHGIQMNGFDGLHLENVEIGPTTNDCWLNHNYAHLRMLLPYLYKMANWDEHHMEQTISFDSRDRTDGGREYTLNDLIDVAVEKLDKVFKYVTMNEDEWTKDDLLKKVEEDEDFNLFINQDGLPYGAVVYGLYLNYPGSGIFGWDVSDLRPKNLYMKNVEIHDLTHSGNEIFALSKNKKRFTVNTLLAPINMEHILGGLQNVRDWITHSYTDGDHDYKPNYVGNIATDIYFAMYKFGSDRYDEWWLGAPYLGLNDRLVDWVQGNDDDAMSSKFGGLYWEPVCSMDGMSHPGKGIVGIKLSNADNVQIEGYLKIHDLYDYTPLGEEGVCITVSNSYGLELHTKVTSSEQYPYQTAFSMNQIFAFSAELSNVEIHKDSQIQINNLESRTGRVLGLIGWYSTKFKFKGEGIKVQINDIFAGMDVGRRIYSYFDQPNHKAESCAFAAFSGPSLTPEIDLFKDTEIDQYCVYGNTGCWNEDDYSNVDVVDNHNKQCETKTEEDIFHIFFEHPDPADTQSSVSNRIFAGSQYVVQSISSFASTIINSIIMIVIIIITSSVLLIYIKNKSKAKQDGYTPLK